MILLCNKLNVAHPRQLLLVLLLRRLSQALQCTMIWTVLAFGRQFVYRTESRVVTVPVSVIVGGPNCHRFRSTYLQVQYFLDDDSGTKMMIVVTTVHPVGSLVFGVDIVMIVTERNRGDGELCRMTTWIGNTPVVLATSLYLLPLIRGQVYEDTFMDAVVSLAVGVWLVGGFCDNCLPVRSGKQTRYTTANNKYLRT
jgi:hypothetical protein